LKLLIQSLVIMCLLAIISFLGINLYEKISNSEVNVEANFPKNGTGEFAKKISADQKLTGTVGFINDYKTEVSEKELGVIFISKIKRNGEEQNLFGANNAQIKVRDSTGRVVGLGNVGKQGNFSIDIKTDDFYDLEISFRGIQRNLSVSKGQNNLKIYLGYLNVANGKWSDQASLQ
jgi:hypothetical protein